MSSPLVLMTEQSESIIWANQHQRVSIIRYLNESFGRISVLLSLHREVFGLFVGTRKMVDWPAAPKTDPSR